MIMLIMNVMLVRVFAIAFLLDYSLNLKIKETKAVTETIRSITSILYHIVLDYGKTLPKNEKN